jgi:prepilin-type N-terminal cleavage/methylation domain-containing protein
MRKLIKFSSNQSGDTIIEVLIAMAILAVILTGAYATSNRSLITERDAQEHSEALTVAQTQVEDLAAGGTLANGQDCLTIEGGSVQGNGTNCYVESNNIAAGVESEASCVKVAPYCYEVMDTLSTIPNQVDYTSNGTPASFSVNWQNYEVKVTWDSLNGGQDSTDLYYRPN